MDNRYDQNYGTLCYQLLMAILANNKIDHLFAMGFSGDDVRWLQSLNPEELKRITTTPFPVMGWRPTVHKERIKMWKKNVRENREELQQLDEFIMLGASYPLVRYCFGLTDHQFRDRCMLLSVAPYRGRARLPPEDVQTEAWCLFQAHLHLPTRLRILEIGRGVTVPLRDVWSLLKQWEHEVLN